MGIFDLIKQNLDKILIGVGLLAILFWPKIKEALAVAQGEAPPPPANGQPAAPSNNCCCCDDPTEPDYEEADKSTWVISTMKTRAYCVDHRLDEGVELCEKLVNVLVAAKPAKKTVSVSVTRGVSP
jgi:hypothetical protein